MSKINFKSLSLWLVIGIVGVLGVVGTVRAASGFSWERVEDKVAQILADSAKNVEGFLGAAGSRFPNGISADSTSPSTGQVRGTTLTMTGESQLNTVVSGGAVYSTSSLNSTTLTAAQVCDNSVILMSPGTAAINLTLPSTSTLYSDCLDTDGDYKEVIVRNTTGTAATYMTLVAGTGIVSLASPTTTAGVGDLIGTGEEARMRFVRLGDAAGQISVETSMFHDAD